MTKIERPAIPVRLPTDDDVTENIVANKSDIGKHSCHYGEPEVTEVNVIEVEEPT